MPASRFRRALPVLLLVGLALAVRLPHLGWGLPAVQEEAYPAKKAMEMGGFSRGGVVWDPQTAGWPALSFYAELGLQRLQYAVGRATGAYGDPGDYWVDWLLDPTPVILWGRFLSALLSAGIVAAGALLGRRLAGTPGLAIAGLGLAFSPLLVRHAQLIDPDGWVGLFAALAVLQVTAVAEHGRTRDYLLAGLWIGLGTAAKYTPVLLAVSLAAVHLERRRVEGGDLRLLGLDDRRIWLAAAAAAVAFAIVSPYTLLDLAVLRRDLAWQGEHLSEGHFGQAGQGIGWVHYLVRVLPAALGWPLLLAGLGGLVVAARRGPRTRALLWCVLPMFLVLGALHTRFDRYMIPLLAPLAAAAGLLWSPLRARLSARVVRPAAIAAAALLLAPPAWGTLRYHRIQARPSTGVEAAAWLRAHVDAAHQAVLTERYGPELVPDRRDALQRDPRYLGLTDAQRQRLAAQPVIVHQIIPMYSAHPELADWFYDLRQWTAYDWIVTSGGVRGRYLAEPQRFGREAAFYADLDRYASLAADFTPADGLRGPEIRIWRLDDAARRRLLAERGELSLADQRAWYDRVHRAHLRDAAEAAGRAAELAGRWDEAARWAAVLEDVIEPDQRPLARQRRAVALFQAGRLDEAEALFDELSAVPATAATAWGYRGVLAERRGDAAAAAACYREVIARDPDGGAGALARRRLAALGQAR